MVFFVHKPKIASCLERFRAFLIGHNMKKDDILDILAAVFTALMLAFFLFYRG